MFAIISLNMQLAKKLSILIILFVFALLFVSTKKVSYAQNYGSGMYDAQCIGEYVGEYVKGVMDNVGTTQHIVYLSPAFNMTEAQFPELLSVVAETAGSDAWSRLGGIAGNSYNVFWGPVEEPDAHYRITDWVNYARGLPETGGKGFMLTEIGWHELLNQGNGWTPDKNTALESLTTEIGKLKGDSGILGANLFNVFNNNSGWSGYAMSEDEISRACSGSCGKIGGNSATGLWGLSDSVHAQNLGMQRTVGIVSKGDGGVITAVNLLHEKGIRPVIRIGVGEDSGGWDNPADYASFIRQLDAAVTDTVYVIVGPNEPDAEYWVIPEDLREECGRSGGSTGGTIKINGLLKTTRAVKKGNSIVTGQAVKDAKIVAYTQTDGRYFNSPISTSTTLEDGYFELNIPRNIGTDGYVYVVALCGGGETVKDLYKVRTRSDLEGLFIWADCNARADTPNPPAQLEYIKKGQFYACDSPDDTAYYNQLYKGITAFGKSVINTFTAFLEDDTYVGAPAGSVPNDDVSQVCDSNGICFNPRATTKVINGRDTQTSLAQDIAGTYGMVLCDQAGCPEGPPQLPTYPYRHSEEGRDVKCEVYKEANFPVATEKGSVHLTFGSAVALSSPGDELKKRYIATYDLMKEEPICTMDGKIYKWKEFKAPKGWDVDYLNDSVCSGGGCLEPEYFAYSRLFGGERSVSQGVGTAETVTDSVGTAPRTLELERGNPTGILSGGSNPGEYKFGAEIAVAEFPKANNGGVTSPSGAQDVATNSNPLMASLGIPAPVEIIQDPVFETGTSRAGKLTKQYGFSKNSGYYRIGPAKSVCVCSDVDERNNQCKTPLNEFPFISALEKLEHRFAAGSSWVTALNGAGGANSGQGYFMGQQFLGGFIQNIISAFQTAWDSATGPQPGDTCVGDWVTNLNAAQIASCENGDGRCRYVSTPTPHWEMWNDSYSCKAPIQNWEYKQESKVQFLNDGIWIGALNYATAFKSPSLSQGLDVGYKALCTTDSSAVVTVTDKGAFPNEINGSNTVFNKEVTCGDDYVTYLSNDGLAEPSFPNHYFKNSGNARPVSYGVTKLAAVDDELCKLGSDSAFGTGTSPTIPEISDYFRGILESAGDAYGVPGPALLAFMYGEGAFSPNRGYYSDGFGLGSEDDVMQWSIEGPSMEGIGNPPCTSDEQTNRGEGPFGFTYSGWFGSASDQPVCSPNDSGFCNAVRIDFPNRTPNRCNLLDQAYAAAKKLHDENSGTTAGADKCIHPASGDSDPSCNTCFGLPISTDQANSCGEWKKENLVIATRQFAGFCTDNEYSGYLGNGFQLPPNNVNTPNRRQTFTECFGSGAGACSQVTPSFTFNGRTWTNAYTNSYIYNILNVYKYYKVAETPFF